MVRAHLQLHPPRTPAPLLKAATALLLRDSPQGLQVLMTRRSLKASFAPGAYVFPGGGIERADADPATWAITQRRATQTDEGLTQALAAIRESLEELGVLLAQRPNGDWATDADVAQIDRHAPLAPQCQRLGLTLAAHQVWQLALWQTDRDLPKRFDVPFLVAPMPPQQTPVADESEQFEPQWVHPAEALARHEAGQFFIIFPTIRTLQRLQGYPTVADVLAAVAAKDGVEHPLWTSCPRAGLLNGQDARYMEHESPYGELALVCPDGQIAHHLDWQHQQPVPLLKHLQRLTAPNASMMTGPGTNTYIVGTAATGFGVIDPGPNDSGHIQRLVQATGGDIRWVVCTHSHADHAPAARPLAAAVAALGRPQPPIWGLASGPHARPGSQFSPDQTLQNSEHLALINTADQPDSALDACGLQAIHTPGHAANHLCLLLVQDGLLFTGDHILNGSTTVVDPPDGHMGDYLDSLDVLDDLCARHDVRYLLPAHGYAMGQPRQVIAHLKAHRLAREAKVARAMAAKPAGKLDDWLPLAYDDVDPRLWPVARRSLLAHVGRLQPGFVDTH